MSSQGVKRNACSLLCASLLCALFGFGFAHGQGARQTSEELLTNASIIKLVRARFSEKTVTAIIRTRPARFDLTPDSLVQLKRNGVSEKIILAMIARSAATETADDAWGDDEAFFDEDGGRSGGRSGGSNGGGGTDIFGSGSNSQSRTRGRGGLNGGASGDTQTTGSVTARIVRPPSEGGEEPKLERTPTLTNESVVEMVDAGFSEGTIIRRIESSPAAFDLSAAKLAELRRRRVGEKVILAMKEAMGDDAPQRPAASASGN